MPQFSPGESKAAKITMGNPTEKAFDYDGVIYMGTNLVEVSRVGFQLNALEEKVISFPVVMPSTIGTFPVYIGVFSDGKSIALYKAVEDVIIAIVQWAYSDVQASIDGQAGVSVWYWIDFSARITNIGNQAAIKTVALFYRVRYGSNPFSSEYIFKSELLTLLPGESYIFTGWRVPAPGYPEEALTITGGFTYELWLRDSDGKESSRVQVAM